MSRMTGAVVVLLGLLSPAFATLARPSLPDLPADLRPSLARGLPPKAEDVAPPAAAELAADTEVFLNGKRCDYRAVPNTAAVSRILLAADGKTVVRIEFRTTK